MSSTTYEVAARIARPGRAELQAKQARVEFDSSPGAGDELPGPAELLCGAFAACLLKNVERFSELLPFSQHGASVRVSAQRSASPPMFTRLDYVLELVTDEPPRRVDLLQRNLAKHGTVYNTLARACEIDGRIVIVAPSEEVVR